MKLLDARASVIRKDPGRAILFAPPRRMLPRQSDIETTGYQITSPVSADEWSAYHAIRRNVLFEPRGEAYDENHPDEHAAGNHPRLLLCRGDAIGVLRIDLAGTGALLRRVAIRADVQRRGHGRVMLALAERFARDNGCTQVGSSVVPDAVGFYRKCGFSAEKGWVDGPSGPETVFMTKKL